MYFAKRKTKGDKTSVYEMISLTKTLKEKEHINVNFFGTVVNIRSFKEVTFLVLRIEARQIQVVMDSNTVLNNDETIQENMALEINGDLNINKRAPLGFEIMAKKIFVLSHPCEKNLIDLSKHKLNLTLENNLNVRPLSLKHRQMMAIFRLQAGITRGFAQALTHNGFTEIKTPKIVSAGAEGGSNIFRLEYFDKKAFLAQSPQFYKQTMVGVFDRVFEIGPVFRAEKHSTPRHLNEYTSLDFEMGYINGFEDIIGMEVNVISSIFELLKKDYSYELEILKMDLPNIDNGIPCIRFDEAINLINEKYNRKIKNPFDLQPDQEHLIGEYFKKEYNSDFVFVTHYPSKKRPFYAMNDPKDPRYTLSFDLLFRGMEITTGGQRIHNYDMQIEKMIQLGMDPKDFESYLMIHKFGIPPHGGLGIGLERFTMMLTNESNIRNTTLFPRDRNRLIP